MVMVANQTGLEVGYLAGRYPGALGHLYSPGAQRGPYPFLPYALDNGAYPLAQRNLDFDFVAWRALLAWAAGQKQRPLWAAVPDVVYHRERTLEWFREHVGTVRAHGLRPALVLQDGMTFEDVPANDCILFIGGSTAWKEAAIGPWCARFPGRVHVGRVNWVDRLQACYEAGAVSVDGTGWYRKDSGANGGQRGQLVRFIESTHGKEPHGSVYQAAV